MVGGKSALYMTMKLTMLALLDRFSWDCLLHITPSTSLPFVVIPFDLDLPFPGTILSLEATGCNPKIARLKSIFHKKPTAIMHPSKSMGNFEEGRLELMLKSTDPSFT